MQRSYINRAMHDLHTLNKIFIPIFELVISFSINSSIPFYQTIGH